MTAADSLSHDRSWTLYGPAVLPHGYWNCIIVIVIVIVLLRTKKGKI